ncbi:hypothetical protein TNCV_1646551 [Trichonephila clavipes]|nr:hypothetical protein TNCV_1646551 [Trichonephila clavipes]
MLQSICEQIEILGISVSSSCLQCLCPVPVCKSSLQIQSLMWACSINERSELSVIEVGTGLPLVDFQDIPSAKLTSTTRRDLGTATLVCLKDKIDMTVSHSGTIDGTCLTEKPAASEALGQLLQR